MKDLRLLEGGKFLPGTWIDGDHMGDWNIHLGTNATLVDAAIPGGVLQGSIVTTSDSILNLTGPRAFEVDVGVPISFQVDMNITVDADNEASFFVGFTDNNTAGEMPMDDDGGTLVSAATDAVGFLYERGEAAPSGTRWQAVSVANGTDGTQTALSGSDAVVLGTWMRLRLKIAASGDTDFYIATLDANHNEITPAWDRTSLRTQTSAVTTSVRLCPVIAQQLHTGSSVVTFQTRNAMFRGNGLEVTGS